jgi:hypothetical protein
MPEALADDLRVRERTEALCSMLNINPLRDRGQVAMLIRSTSACNRILYAVARRTYPKSPRSRRSGKADDPEGGAAIRPAGYDLIRRRSAPTLML